MNKQELQQFFSQLPPELQEKVSKIPDEQQKMQVLTALYQKYLMKQGQIQSAEQPMAMYGYKAKYGYAQDGMNTQEKVPVEAERNELLVRQEGTPVDTKGGYLKQKSSNPITGESTYEIPDNKHNNTHEKTGNGSSETGVNMNLTPGDVINSDKTKIDFDFLITGTNYKGKTFLDAGKKISDLEKKQEKKLKELQKSGQLDEVAEQTIALNFAKFGKLRQELNDAQEIQLELNKQIETNKETDAFLGEFGINVKKLNKANNLYSENLHGFINDRKGYKDPNKVIKAEKGLNARIAAMDTLMETAREKNLDVEGISATAKQLGLLDSYGSSAKIKSSIEPFAYNPSSDTLQQFKDVLAGEESRGSENPYAAYNPNTSEGTWGKYQFVWSLWKNKIKQQTGITDPKEWIKNPAAQEQFMDWYIKNNLMPTAAKLKQKYQMPFNIYEIMSALHLEGEKGFVQKYKSGQLDQSTMAGKFKNKDTQSYMSAFSQFPDEQPEMKFGGNIPKYTPQNYFTIEDDNNKYFPKRKAVDGINTKSPFTLWEGDVKPPNQPRLNKANYELSDLDWINQNVFQGAAKNNYDIQKMIFNEYQNITGQAPKRFYNGQLTDELAQEDGRLGDDLKLPIQTILDYYKNNSANQTSNPSSPIVRKKEEVTFLDPILPEGIVKPGDIKDINRNNYPLSSVASNTSNTSQSPSSSEGAGFENPQASWWQKMNYGVDKMLPAANALSLLMEKPIYPTLQRKPARYTPMRTDVDINPQLNEAQRMYQTVQADTRGNPSVRAARLAQMYANSEGNMNQVLANKYNMETQIGNQEIARRDQYFNQLDDVNRNYQKQFETENLQLLENMRNQRRNAVEFMMNAKLRDSEQNRATELALANTIYDYDPVTGQMVVNPTKYKQHIGYRTQMMKYENLLNQMQKAQEELKNASTAEEKKTLEEQIRELEKKQTTLETQLSTPPQKKKLGGRITSKKQQAKDSKIQQSLNPEFNYRKYFPTY